MRKRLFSFIIVVLLSTFTNLSLGFDDEEWRVGRSCGLAVAGIALGIGSMSFFLSAAFIYFEPDGLGVDEEPVLSEERVEQQDRMYWPQETPEN